MTRPEQQIEHNPTPMECLGWSAFRCLSLICGPELNENTGCLGGVVPATFEVSCVCYLFQ